MQSNHNTIKKTLVGRSTEIATIRSGLQSLKHGSGNALLICGEPGIGKSSLAQQLAEDAHKQHLPVHWGFCWEAGAAPAYWPWTQLLRSLLKAQQIPAEQLTSLSQILPEYYNDKAQCSDPGPSPQLHPDQARFQLLEAVRGLLEDSGRQQSMVIIFEDLHAADNDSLQLLHYVTRHLHSMPILICGTFRDTEARNSRSSESLWRTVRDAKLLQLTRLSVQDISALLRQQTRAAPSEKQLEQLFATSEGNPLFLSELMSLLQHGIEPTMARLPDSVQQVIQQQLARLPEATQELLATASILGREFSTRSLVELCEQSYRQVCALLQPATASGIITIISVERNRFCHMLYREVLHQGLETWQRQQLHLRFARILQRQIETEDHDNWAYLAEHWHAAGCDHRQQAVAAWRHAAVSATRRLAFSEAAAALEQALNVVVEDTAFDPAERCRLMLECANAMLAAGDSSRGQQLCRQAFAIASTMDDTGLMARAALSNGSVIVAASVDQDLIAMLQQTLGKLPADDNSTRARLAARLAAALQPAARPREPVNMALEAIALARSTGDDRVIHEVLHSAIAALMDFYPASKRVPLNRELGNLAERFGDIPGQFRSDLRLVIDACELADRSMLDEAIAACRLIADRLQLPHYQWWANSVSALTATIEGRYSEALDLLDRAQAQAETISDNAALLAIALQRLMLVDQWHASEAPQWSEVRQQLEQAMIARPNTRVWVLPFLAVVGHSRGYPDDSILEDQVFIEQVFADGDHLSIAHIGELAIMEQQLDLARRAYETLLPFKHDCVSLGLFGPSWHGPLAKFLGTLAAALGEPEQARGFLVQALKTSASFGATPMTAQIQQLLATLDHGPGHNHRAPDPTREIDDVADSSVLATTADTNTAIFSMILEGDIWRVTFDCDSTLIKQSKGMTMLAMLLAKSGDDVHVLDLASPAASAATGSTGDCGPMLDKQARAAYQTRVAQLREAIEEAEELGDSQSRDRFQQELDVISRELSRAFGLGGRQRDSGSAAERARVNVQRRLRDAIERIAAQLPKAGAHLKACVKTGSYCKYSPM